MSWTCARQYVRCVFSLVLYPVCYPEAHIFLRVAVPSDDGRDYIPRTIDEYYALDEVDLYVCDYDASSSIMDGTSMTMPEKTCASLLCGMKDGCTYRMWGARTHPSYRGRGIMKFMMKRLQSELIKQESAVKYVVSTTIAENQTMLRIFQELDYVEHSVVYGWPDSKHARKMDELMEQYYTCSINSRGLNDTSVSGLGWKTCTSSMVLCNALSSIRTSGEGLDRVWIPASYETVSADGATVQRMIDQQQVHIAYHQHGIDGPEMPLAVLVLLEDQLGNVILGVVHKSTAESDDIIQEYCTRILREETSKTIKRIYIDTCGGGAPACSPHHSGPQSILTLSQEAWFEYLVIKRDIPFHASA